MVLFNYCNIERLVMKKFVLFAFIVGTALTATAHANYYVQGNVGVAKLSANTEGETLKDNSTAFLVGVGKQIGNVRYGLDVGTIGKIKQADQYSHTALNAQFHSVDTNEVTGKTLGVGAFYDFKTSTPITPYVGARLGLNRLAWDNTNTVTITYQSGSKEMQRDSFKANKTQVGYGVVAGASYQVAPQWAVDANVSYDHLGKIKWTHEDRAGSAKLGKTALNVGVRYQF